MATGTLSSLSWHGSVRNQAVNSRDWHHCLAGMFFFEMSGNRLLVHHTLDVGYRRVATTGIHFDLVTARTSKREPSHSLILPNGRPIKYYHVWF